MVGSGNAIQLKNLVNTNGLDIRISISRIESYKNLATTFWISTGEATYQITRDFENSSSCLAAALL